MNISIKYAASERDLDRALSLAEKILGEHGGTGDRSAWLKRMNTHPELLLYAEAEGELAGIVFSHLEGNGNVTVGIVAVDERFRKREIAKKLMLAAEEQALWLGAPLIALGSVGSAEGFYEKLGYTGQLLIQSERHSVEELAARNPGYPVAFTNIYDGNIHQLCLRLEKPDRALQRLYETVFDDCHTQTMFWKTLREE